MQAVQSLREVVERLETILRAEKAALLSADYVALGGAVAEKDGLSASLESLLLDRANAGQEAVLRKRLSALVRLAQENENLMLSAKIGVAAAKARIKDIINRQRNIGVYSENGERPFVPGAAVTRQKLA
jgi:hypothetical protein